MLVQAVVVTEDSLCEVVDCRGFTDPQKGSRRHLGMHATNLSNIVKHKGFPEFFPEAALAAMRQARVRRWQVVVHCLLLPEGGAQEHGHRHTNAERATARFGDEGRI